MFKTIKFILIGMLMLISVPNVFAADNQFKKNNPDGGKYEFARSYISALSYFQKIRNRWENDAPKKKFPKPQDDLLVIRASMDYLVMDNIDLRVSKNYMVKYLESPNRLMRKVADMMIVACDTDIALNNKSKSLWQDWLNKKVRRKQTPKEEADFIAAQSELETKRKESDKSIIKASILLSKVLLSQDNTDDQGKLLAITQKQRNKLLDNLDVYGKDVLDWGLKSGQSTLNASISVIREVLEDPLFITRN